MEPPPRRTAEVAGRVVDLHPLCATLGTQLARAGVAPQGAQRVLRHADFRTTQRHYTMLDLESAAAAIKALPGIKNADPEGPEDSECADAPSTRPAKGAQLYSQQSGQQKQR
jgi:hypothetical protein